MENVKNIVDVQRDLKNSQDTLPKTLNEHLGNLEITKEELEQFKEKIKDDPTTLEKALESYSIRKKLHTVLNEKALHDNLQEAITFLDEILELNK